MYEQINVSYIVKVATNDFKNHQTKHAMLNILGCWKLGGPLQKS